MKPVWRSMHITGGGQLLVDCLEPELLTEFQMRWDYAFMYRLVDMLWHRLKGGVS